MIFSYLLNMQSHPSWVCGLKLIIAASHHRCGSSHPSWVCGLKHGGQTINLVYISHTLRGCVD